MSFRNVTSLPANTSVVFIEGSDPAKVMGTDLVTADATLVQKFETAWFGSNVPAGFIIGVYGGPGVGLGSSGDQVNVYNASGTEVTGVAFGATTLGITLDNSAGIGGTTTPPPTISTNSVAGVNGAFVSPSGETGSPGTAVPEPASLGLAAVATLALLRRRK